MIFYFYRNKNKKKNKMQVNISGVIKENMANLVYEFIFINQTNDVLNPTHYLSLDENSTITNLTLKIGDRILNSNIKEVNVAHSLYNKAKQEGRIATIFESISKTEYKLSFCNVIPQETAIITINFNSYLEIDSQGFYKFFIPTNIALKYGNQNILYTSKDILNYNFDILWTTVNKFEEIIGDFFPIDFKTIRVIGNKFPRNGDYIIRVKSSNIPSLYYYKENTSLYAIVNLKVGNSQDITSGKIYNFILDCSDSMSEKFKDTTKINSAKLALREFLSKLKPDDYFNVILFGSYYNSLFLTDVIASRENINIALNLNINANYGGTKLKNCLLNYISHYNNLENEKIIILITDGQIYDKKDLFNEIKSYHDLFEDIKNCYKERTVINSFRIFTIGIGNDVDRNLIKELSVITNGDFFCASDNNRFLYNIDMIMTYSRSNYYKNAKICYSNSYGTYYFLENLNNYHALYPNKTYMFCLNMNNDFFENNNFYVECQSSKSDKIIKCNIKKENMIETDISVKNFYYNAMINKYEDQLSYDNLSIDKINELTTRIINLSIEGCIMSDKTAFLIDDYVFITEKKSKDYIVPNYLVSEEVDALEGGMCMYSCTRRDTTIVYNENCIFSDLHYDSEQELLNQINVELSCNLICKIIMYMEFRNKKDLSEFLSSILQNDIISPYLFLKIERNHKCHITSLSNQNTYSDGDY